MSPVRIRSMGSEKKSQDFIKSPYNFSYGDAVKRAWSYGVRVALQPLKLAIRVQVPVRPKFRISPHGQDISLSPRRTGIDTRIRNANLAQSVERAPFKRVAVGSIPTVGNEMESLDTRYLQTDWREIRRLKHSPLWPSGLRRRIQDPLDRKIRMGSNPIGGSKVTTYFLCCDWFGGKISSLRHSALWPSWSKAGDLRSLGS